jgi:hypothetical protein
MQHGRLSWSDSSAPHKLLAVLLGTYVALQIAIPLRHYLQDGNPSWTEEGHYFAWHMLLRGKYPAVRFYATEPRTGRTGAVDLRRYVTPHQMRRFARDPRMIHEMSQIIAADLRSLGFRDVQVRVLALVSMNGRKPQLMIDPTVDLAAEPRHWKRPGWIVPLTEPLRERPWDVPLEEWERHVEIPLQYRRPEASLTNTKTPNPKPKSQVPSKS